MKTMNVVKFFKKAKRGHQALLGSLLVINSCLAWAYDESESPNPPDFFSAHVQGAILPIICISIGFYILHRFEPRFKRALIVLLVLACVMSVIKVMWSSAN